MGTWRSTSDRKVSQPSWTLPLESDSENLSTNASLTSSGDVWCTPVGSSSSGAPPFSRFGIGKSGTLSCHRFLGTRCHSIGHEESGGVNLYASRCAHVVWLLADSLLPCAATKVGRWWCR